MDNSDIWYYVALGAIYFLSRIFGKKKPKPKQVFDRERGHSTMEEERRETPESVPTLEDVFRELTGEARSEPEIWEKPLKAPEEPMAEGVELMVSPAEESPEETTQAAKPVPLKYERAEHFQVEEQDDTFKEELHDFLSSYDGLKKAVVLKEILDRRY